MRLLLIVHLNSGEEETTRLTAGRQPAVHADADELLAVAAVDLVDAHAGCHTPDRVEGDAGELAAPVERNEDAADGGEELVAAAEAARVALVGVLPHAVDGARGFGLAEHILKQRLWKRGKYGTRVMFPRRHNEQLELRFL